MRTPPRARWLAGIMLVLALGPIIIWWWLTPLRVTLPIERLMPARTSVALRLVEPRRLWQDHWQGVGRPQPEVALQAVYEALDKWPKMVKKDGELVARTKLRMAQEALFNVLGDEVWVVFGEWEGEETKEAGEAKDAGEGQVGLVAFFRGDTAKAGIGPLMNLMMEDHQLIHDAYKGIPLYEYRDRKLSRSVTFCQVGGWMVASLRQRGHAPLEGIIDQVHRLGRTDGDKGEATAREGRIAWPELVAAHTTSTLLGVARPAEFWGQLRRFNLQRGKGFSEKSEDGIRAWEQRLEGVEQAVFYQHGHSVLDLKLEVTGPRPRQLAEALTNERTAHPLAWDMGTTLTASTIEETTETQALGSAAVAENDAESDPLIKSLLGESATTLTEETSAATSSSLALLGLGNEVLAGAAPTEAPAPALGQLDVSLAFARMAPPLAGFSWSDLMDEWPEVRLLAPGLFGAIEDQLVDRVGGEDGRLGAGIYSTSNHLLPGVLYWLDRMPLRRMLHDPAANWSAGATWGGVYDPQAEGDLAAWVPLPGADPAPAGGGEKEKAWGLLLSDFWRTPDDAPEAFIAVSFDRLSQEMERIPTGMMKKKAAKKFKKSQQTARALSLCLGGIALRMDVDGNAWVVTTRTM